MTGVLLRSDIESFRSLIAERLGLHFEDGKLDFLDDILRQRMKATGDDNFSAYRQRALSFEPEMRTLAERLTVCETYFFRYAEHFRAFTEGVVPDRIRTQGARRQLRILSAGCASGEEAYSLAILIRDQLPSLMTWDIAIHGIDINPSMVKKAVRARYLPWSLRETPADIRTTYFREQGRELALDHLAKSMVSFEERNLVDADPAFWRPGAFDVIFCRNVMMYFTPEAARSLVKRLAQALTPGGFLFLGHAETLRGISQDFHLRHTHETFYYQLRDDMDAHPAVSSEQSAATSVVATHMSALVAASDSWFDVVQRASKRIATLTNAKNGGTCGAPASRPLDRALPLAVAWDRTAVMELLEQEKFPEALELLRRLPPEARADPDAQLLLAVLLTNRGELAEAEGICFRLLNRDELNAGAHYLMALCREHTGDRDGAAEHDQAAIYLDSGFSMPHLHLGLLAKGSSDTKTAKREFGQALALLLREDPARILVFGGGFTREALAEFCRAQLRACGVLS